MGNKAGTYTFVSWVKCVNKVTAQNLEDKEIQRANVGNEWGAIESRQ